MLSLTQIAAKWWPPHEQSERSVKGRLKLLEAEGLVMQARVMAHPLIALEAPLVVWKQRSPVPDFGPISYRLKSRWNQTLKLTPIVAASKIAGNWLGGHGGRLPRTSEASHDLCLAQVYLQLLSGQPERAKKWVSEAELYHRGGGRNQKLPDAVVWGRGVKTAIEFGGAYSKKKLEDFHAYCEENGFAYEIW